MARVPTIRRRRPVTDVPAPLDTRGVESPFSQVLESALALRDVIDAGLRDEGAEAGTKAVGRDEDGNIVVDQPGFLGRLLPEYSAARKNAAEAAYLATAETDIREELTKLRDQFPVDAAGYNEAAEAVIARFRDAAPGEFSPGVFRMASNEAQRVSRGIQARAERIELQKQEGALLASIGDKENQLFALARQGGTDTPEFQEIAAAYRDQIGVLVSNPLFAFSQEEAELRIGNTLNRAALEASSRDVLGVYGARGEQAAISHARRIADGFPHLTDAQREEWVADQRVLINEREAARNKARAGLKRLNARRIDDAVATLAAGNDASSMLNDQSLFAPFNAAERQLAREELAAAKRAGQARKQMQGADPATRAEILDSFVVEGEGAALTARYKASLQTEAAAIARRIDKDPAAHVAQTDPDLAADLNEAIREGDPDKFAAAAASFMEEQVRLGATNPRLLSKPQRQALAANITGDEADENRAQNAVDEIQRLASVTQGHFPRIMAELAEEDDFPAALYGVGVLDGKEHAQFMLAEAALEDPKVLRENVGKLGTGATSDLRGDLAGQTSELVSTLALSGWSQTRIDKVTDSVEALASQMAIEQGKTRGAAKKAFEAMFGDYHFEGSYRVPARFDPDRVRAGTEALEERFQGDDFIVPNPDPRMTPRAAGRSYVSHLRSFGQWVTNRDETGLFLVDGDGKPVMERPLNPGERPQLFEISFEQLEALSREGQRAEGARRLRRATSIGSLLFGD